MREFVHPVDVTVVVATRNRWSELRRTLARLTALPERPAVIVVDNGSTDETAQGVASEFPGVRLVRLDRNHGPTARTIGARLAATSLVAFSDDDSWWAPESLRHAARLFDRHSDLALIAATVLVGDDERLDPVTETMRRDDLPSDGLPGPAVLGFLACSAVLRREAFLGVGGFAQPRVGGEETLLAIDLAAAGWQLAHIPTIVVHHHPSARRDAGDRSTAELHNRLRTAWLRLPVGDALGRSAAALRRAVTDRDARRSIGLLLREAPWLARHRRRIPAALASQLARVSPPAGRG